MQEGADTGIAHQVDAPSGGGSEAGSCKLEALRCMVKAATSRGERVVCVSTSTRMLDAAQLMCERLGASCARIDGSTAPAVRQDRVDSFNSPNGPGQVRPAS